MAARLVKGLALACALGGVLPAHAADAPVCDGANGYAASFDGGRLFLWRPDWLEQTRQQLQQDDARLAAAKAALFARADAALTRPRYSVVDKTRLPASGNRHDYMSMGPYWWADPSKADGLPYIRRDGRFNPERDSDAFDVTRLEAMTTDVQALALAYYFTGQARYADKAVQQLRAWFLDQDTRMNPNFEHGQAIPGKVAGRAEGIIDAHRFPRVIESIGILQRGGKLQAGELQGLQAWFGALAQWMQDSRIGKEERAARNNHGLYYDTLLTHFALFAGDRALAERVAERAKVVRLAAQINSKGALTEELTRTRSLHYVTWTLNAAYDLADLGRCAGVDLWDYQARNGNGSLRKATDFIAAYAGDVAAWPYPELDKRDTQDFHKAMLRAAWQWREPAYLQGARALAAGQAGSEWTLLIPPPVLPH